MMFNLDLSSKIRYFIFTCILSVIRFYCPINVPLSQRTHIEIDHIRIVRNAMLSRPMWIRKLGKFYFSDAKIIPLPPNFHFFHGSSYDNSTRNLWLILINNLSLSLLLFLLPFLPIPPLPTFLFTCSISSVP